MAVSDEVEVAVEKLKNSKKSVRMGRKGLNNLIVSNNFFKRLNCDKKTKSFLNFIIKINNRFLLHTKFFKFSIINIVPTKLFLFNYFLQNKNKL